MRANGQSRRSGPRHVIQVMQIFFAPMNQYVKWDDVNKDGAILIFPLF
jgi:hypothetical protein